MNEPANWSYATAAFPWWLLLIYLPGAVMLPWLARHERLGRLDGREALSLETLHARFFSDIPLGTFTPALALFEQSLDVPVGLIRPTDRFDAELAPAATEAFDSPLDILWETAVGRYGDSVTESQFEAAQNVGDYVRLFAALEEAAGLHA